MVGGGAEGSLPSPRGREGGGYVSHSQGGEGEVGKCPTPRGGEGQGGKSPIPGGVSLPSQGGGREVSLAHQRGER